MRRLEVLGGRSAGAVVCLLLGVAASSTAQERPSWYDHVQVFQDQAGYYIYADPSVNSAPFTGEPWGIFFPNDWTAAAPDLLAKEVAAWHAHSGVYMASTNMCTVYNDPRPDLDPARMLDVSGKLANDPFANSPQYTLSSPLWQSALQQVVADTVAFGPDGLHIDGLNTPSNLVLPYNTQAASFDSFTMTAFRTFLRVKYTDAQLTSQFEIADPANFDYGAWIRANHQETTWNRTPLQGLAAEFYAFRLLENKHFLHGLVDLAHQSGQARLGRPFTVSGNIAFDIHGYYLLDEVDYFVNEKFTLDADFLPLFANIDIRTFKGIKDWPVVVLWEPWKDGLPRSTTNMIRLAIADIYASGGTISFRSGFTDWSPAKLISIDYSIFKRYVEFILAHHDLYEDLHFTPHVALLNSMASRITDVWPCEGGCRIAGWDSAFYGMGQLLLDTNTQFDVLFAPDVRFSNLPSFTLDQLRKYRVVVLPDTFVLDDLQAATILDYVRGGGVVFASGDIGTHLPGGARASRPDLIALQRSDGDHVYGSGHFFYTQRLLGQDYTRDPTQNPTAVRQNFVKLLAPYTKAEVATSEVSTVYRYGGATVFVYNNADGDYVLHLVNYDYNENTDEFAAKENVVLTIGLDTTKTWNAEFFSPDLSSEQDLVVWFQGDSVAVTIPRLEAYGVLRLRHGGPRHLPVVGSVGGGEVRRHP